MSRMLGKRGRAETGPVGDEVTILNLIKSKRDLGIWKRHITFESKITENVVTKVLKSLLAKNLIKEVKNIQNKAGKHYMAVEFEPSNEISGGDFYTDGQLDHMLLEQVKGSTLRYIKAQKVATIEGVLNVLKRVVTFNISTQQVAQILNSMVLDNDIMEVKSTGLGDYHTIPVGKICYRVVSGIAKVGKVGWFASIPCGVCPMTRVCSPDGGIVTPSKCAYYTNWLKLEF